MSTAFVRPHTRGLPLHELVAGLHCEATAPSMPDAADAADPVVFGVSLDSRSVVAGDLYAALPGFNRHGADFAAEAARRGAVAVLTDPQGALLVPAGLPVVVTAAPRDVLGEVAARVYGHPSSALTMVGITGTNGKTTTAYLIESALRAHGRRTGLIGTVETRLGDEVLEAQRTTPEATDLHALLAVMLERGLDTCVMEVSSHALTLHRVDGAIYDVALFTNLSQDHLDFHADMEDYYRAKASLFTADRSRAAVIDVDDEWGARLASETRGPGKTTLPVTTLSTSAAAADWTASQVHDDGRFTLAGPSGARLQLCSHLPGTFNVANTALAALALLQVGLDVAAIEQAMAVPPDVPGRMQVVAPGRPPSADGPGSPRCIVDFAHTPDAVEAALLAVRSSTRGRLVVVLGAGGDRDRSKRHAMGVAAARNADVVVVTDDNPRSEDPAAIREALLSGARSVLSVFASADSLENSKSTGSSDSTDSADTTDDADSSDGTGSTESSDSRLIERGGRASAIESAIALAADGGLDTVIVLGKGHEKGQEIAGVVHPFDDRDAVLSALSALAAKTDRSTTRPLPAPSAPSPTAASSASSATTRPASGETR